MKKYNLFILAMIISNQLQSQPRDSIPSREDLFKSLREFHTEQTAANLAAVNVREKWKWLDFLPQIGVTLGKPTIGFNAAQFTGSLRSRELRKAETQKILRNSVLSFKSDSLELENLLKKREALIENLEAKLLALKFSLEAFEDVAKLETAVFKLEERRNDEGKVLPSEWLKIQASYIKSQYPMLSKREEIRIYEASKVEELRNLEALILKHAKN